MWEVNVGQSGALTLPLTFSRGFSPPSSSGRRNDGLPADETKCYLLIIGPHCDPWRAFSSGGHDGQPAIRRETDRERGRRRKSRYGFSGI